MLFIPARCDSFGAERKVLNTDYPLAATTAAVTPHTARPQQASFTGRHYRHERCRRRFGSGARRRQWSLRLAFPFHSILMPDGCFSTPMVLFSTHIHTLLLARRNFKLQFSIIFSMQAAVVNGILRLAVMTPPSPRGSIYVVTETAPDCGITS